MRMKCAFVKNSSENAPWSERSAALHAGAIKPEQGFCGSSFGFLQSVRCRFLRTRVTKAQNEIGVKSKYRVRSIRLSFENFISDSDDAPYSKMASNFVIL